jgi:hypothetical protein
MFRFNLVVGFKRGTFRRNQALMIKEAYKSLLSFEEICNGPAYWTFPSTIPEWANPASHLIGALNALTPFPKANTTEFSRAYDEVRNDTGNMPQESECRAGLLHGV